MAKQLALVKNTWAKDRFAFGGALLKGSHPKGKRPFNAKAALHLVIRSSQARGKQSLLLHDRAIAAVVNRQAERHSVTLYAVANAGNHLHVLMRAPSREHLANFLRAFTGRVAQLVSGTKGFWDARPFSRIVGSRADFKNVARYVGMNSTETLGMARNNVRAMFERIREAIRDGRLPRNSKLVAAGFA